jgi:hypothetical protein
MFFEKLFILHSLSYCTDFMHKIFIQDLPVGKQMKFASYTSGSDSVRLSLPCISFDQSLSHVPSALNTG